MTEPTAREKTIAGFVGGLIGVLVFHQLMYLALQQSGITLPGRPWNMSPSPAAYGLPVVVNQAFWGGVWGVVFALLYSRLPPRNAILKGIVFGMVFPMLLGSWLLVALVKGQPVLSGLFVDGNVMRLRAGFLLNGIAFGAGLGLVYPLVLRLLGRRAETA